MKKIKSNFASNNEIKKLITKYNSKYYLKLVNNVYTVSMNKIMIT